MCKKSEERKFNHYDIKIVNNLNRTTEDISLLNEEKVDKSNYKQMLEVYREIKEQYKDQDVTIDFCGVADDSSMKVMWNKQYKPYDERESIFELCNELNTIVQKFKIIKMDSQDLQGVYDKKEDKELHNLDSLKKKNKYELTEKEKDDLLRIAINLQAIRSDRRYNKYELNLVKSLVDVKAWTKLFSLNDLIQEKKNKFTVKNENNKQLYSGNKIDKSKMYKEIHYKDFKDRIRIMKELKEKDHFEKITYDDRKCICIGYNKIYKNK